MPQKLPQYFASTYTRLIINQCASLQRVIVEHSCHTKDKIKATESEPAQTSLIEDNQLNDILNGPLSPFVKLSMRSLSKLLYLKQQVTIDSESLFEESKQVTTNLKLLDKEGLKKMSVSEIERLQDSLSKLITELNAEWKNQLDTWASEIKNDLQQHQCELNSNNTEELFMACPISELLDRLHHLKIEPIKLKKQTHFNFNDYLLMKTQIAIQNQLNQQHETNIEKRMKDILKQCKKRFKTISSKENELLQENQKEFEKLLEPVQFVNATLSQTA